MNTKYKVGDKVRVRPDLKEWETYRNKNNAITDIVTEPMRRMGGKVATIAMIVDGKYCIEEDGKKWHWTDEMFEEEYTITQADIIRSMSDEELASFLRGYCHACVYGKKRGCPGKECLKGTIEWLDTKVKKDEKIKKKSLEYYMGLPYKLEVIPDSSSGGYVMKYPDLKGCISQCDRKEDIMIMAEDAKREWLAACLFFGIEIPEPDRG